MWSHPNRQAQHPEAATPGTHGESHQLRQSQLSGSARLPDVVRGRQIAPRRSPSACEKSPRAAHTVQAVGIEEASFSKVSHSSAESLPTRRRSNDHTSMANTKTYAPSWITMSNPIGIPMTSVVSSRRISGPSIACCNTAMGEDGRGVSDQTRMA